jgi:pimeloyl-ACP methyl ester carboxylesterase
LRDYASDVVAICDEIGRSKISLLSYAYGSNAALGIAHALPDMVERVTLSSVSYTNYVNANWRERDMFYQVTNVIGRRWPALLKRLIPFLARSVIQNVDAFADRMLHRAECDHERAVLSDHRIRERTSAMVAERTANGFEGVIEEYRINAQPYDFEVSEIAAPINLFHGTCDVHNPIGGAELLAQDAPNAKLHKLAQMGQHHIFKEWPWIFEAAMGQPFALPQSAQPEKQIIRLA